MKHEVTELLKPHFIRLQTCESNLLDKYKELHTSGNEIYHLDLYIQGIVNRSLSLLYGFETLLISGNFKAAAHLVRPHLDNHLRLYAAWLVENPHHFAAKVMAGEKINKLRCRNGQKLQNWYLKEKASEEYEWISRVYEETSGLYISAESKCLLD